MISCRVLKHVESMRQMRGEADYWPRRSFVFFTASTKMTLDIPLRDTPTSGSSLSLM